MNDAILQGPNQFPDLRAQLMHLRMYPIAISAYIRNIFLMVEMRSEVQFYNEEGNIKDYHMKVACFGVNG